MGLYTSDSTENEDQPDLSTESTEESKVNLISNNVIGLPQVEGLDISAFSRLFANTTNSYKYIFFLSLLDILSRRNFDGSSLISFREITIEMLANAWYPNIYFNLYFGLQDQIANKLNSLNIKIEPKFNDSDKKYLREEISKQNLDNLLIGNFSLMRFVPFRLIRPFLKHQLGRIEIDNEVNKKIVPLAKQYFDAIKPLYCFDGDYPSNCEYIQLHPEWVLYIKINYEIIRSWVAWEWLNYMQRRNPSVPAISNKLFPPEKRESLERQIAYWKLVLQHTNLQCIYSGRLLSLENLSLDHYLPWSFVTHDNLWNLIPTFRDVNSAKSNKLPSSIYFSAFVAMQHIGLTISSENMKSKIWNKYVEHYIADLRLSDTNDLLNIERLRNAYELIVMPQISLATSQGFMPNWSYR
ncbi:MAG: hypothetical protein KME25_32795 [Symplocastrum torsivum CPER-KK1]|uniref:HNH nuclease domain-containing protein n=1 Tax=Symplocastrum torsivum CPER-KK1 TaxID=450513 RepID=A0A951UD62_9CYAN|nr:hypothetical protein [Symplocastrum torsivum CPER-KK1]